MDTALSSSIESVYLSSDIAPYHPVIAAVDFGTSSSGYAFGFRDKDSGDIELSDIQINKWQIGSTRSSTDKAPTTVLLKPDKSFDSFGYEAEDKYAQLCDSREQKGWWYFQRFKMMLYKTKLSRNVMLDDAEGKPMPAKDVFSMVIRHLKECVLEDVKRRIPTTEDDDILYVLTVPAIWSDAAKQFMREAATDPSVGITDDQLKLVLEPEAASVFCRQRKSRVVRESSGNTSFDSLEIGHKYILLDLGGGTADIATHEIIENGRLHEIDYGRGEDLGGQKFDDNFLKFFRDLFGEETFRKWQLSQYADFLQLQRDIEVKKWTIDDTQESDDEINFDLPFSLVKHVQTETGSSVGEMLSHSRFANEVDLEKKDKLLLKNKILRSFFDSILTGVTQHLGDICEHTRMIKTVFMVGGLAKSDFVVMYLKTKFPQYTFIIPKDQGVAVLKGAVLLGNKPHTIAGRIARYSYGVGVVKTFKEGIHDENYKFTRDGKVLCKNIFRKLIEKGQILRYGDTFTMKTVVKARLLETKQHIFHSDLYQSTSDNPVYYTEPGCTELGGFKECPPKGGWPDEIKSEVKLTVGEAEFKFYVTESSGRKYEATMDFLAQK